MIIMRVVLELNQESLHYRLHGGLEELEEVGGDK